MTKKKRYPLIALQKAIYKMLTPPVYEDGAPVYDNVPKGAKLPYITFGDFTCKPDGTKDLNIYSVTMTLNIWSEYSGKKQVNEIAEDVTTILTLSRLDLSEDKYKLLEQDCNFFEAFPEERFGYCGVITFVAKIQDMEV